MSVMGRTAGVAEELAVCRGEGSTRCPPEKQHRCSEHAEGETCISLVGNSIVLASVFILNTLCWKFAFQKCQSLGENLMHFDIPLVQSFSFFSFASTIWPRLPP